MKRYPRLDTVMMIETHIREHDGEFKRKELWESLPKKMMYQTFKIAMDYLIESNKISIDSIGKVGWIYYPKSKINLMNDEHLFWRDDASVKDSISGRENEDKIQSSEKKQP